MTYYDDLGVGAEAGDDEIRKAYFRKVRQHPPESDSMGYQRIRTAYEVLSDKSKRSSYDASLSHGGRITALEEQISEYMEKEDWAAAEACLKEVIVLDPEHTTARNKLALTLAYQGRFVDAIRAQELVIRRFPEDSTYRMNLGHIWFKRAQQEDDNAEYFRHALEEFKVVTQQEGFHSDAWLMRARTECKLGLHDDAWRSVEAAVGADGKEDLGDLESLFYMLELSILTHRPETIGTTTQRIAQITNDNSDAREYATGRLLVLVNALVEIHAFQAALRMQQAAATLDPTNADIRKVLESLKTIVGAIDEFDHLGKDSAVPAVLQATIALWLADVCGEDVKASSRENLNQAIAGWVLTEGPQCRTAISHVRRRYPCTAKQFADRLNSIYNLAPSTATAPATPAAAQNSGCALVLFLAGLLAVSTLVACY